MGDVEIDLRGKDSGELIARWLALNAGGPPRPDDLPSYRAIGHALAKKGEPLLAVKVLGAGLKAFADDPTLRRLMALALARIGATHQALTIVQALEREGAGPLVADDERGRVAREETLSLLARLHKDLGAQAHPHDPEAAAIHWAESLRLYDEARTLRGNYFPAINVAALSAMLGRDEEARSVAGQVRAQCETMLEQSRDGTLEDDDYWLLATLGEASLIAGDLGAAEAWYHQAATVGLAERRLGDIASTRRQLATLGGFLGLDPSSTRALFPMPRMAVFVGHMIDREGRPEPRFPSDRAEAVKAEIRDWLAREDVLIGFASAACGADLLFHEALLERGGRTSIILPYDVASFRATSVDFAGPEWARRFEDVAAKATVLPLAGPPLKPSEVALDYANQLLDGFAVTYARQLDVELRRLVVWNGRPGDGPGGTGDVAARWIARGEEVHVIPVPDVTPAAPFATRGWTAPAPRPPSAEASDFGIRIQALLFADVVKFSELSEEQIPAFVRECLQLVADLLDRWGPSVTRRNTWGDGIYVVFDDLRSAGQFALELASEFRTAPWSEKGLPAHLSIRTALHAGPVFFCTDPVTHRPNCIGTHVSHAARIEPITVPGMVFASEAFAVLASAQRIEEFTCHFLGNPDLPKGYGAHPTYHVTPRTP